MALKLIKCRFNILVVIKCLCVQLVGWSACVPWSRCCRCDLLLFGGHRLESYMFRPECCRPTRRATTRSKVVYSVPYNVDIVRHRMALHVIHIVVKWFIDPWKQAIVIPLKLELKLINFNEQRTLMQVGSCVSVFTWTRISRGQQQLIIHVETGCSKLLLSM